VTRLLPKSLAGQMLLLLGLALLIAQLANFALILNERQKLSLAQNEQPAIQRFANVAADLRDLPPERRAALAEDNSRRGGRFALAAESHVQAGAERDPDVEQRLAEALSSAGVAAGEVRAAQLTETWQNRRRGNQRPEVPVLALSARLGDSWLNARLVLPRPEPYLTLRLVAATLLLYLIVLGATVLIAVRLARPLRDLERAATAFGGRGGPIEVEPRGPADLRRAIDAFNAMNRRVVALLDEKDRMLGAIGHDLRTPLASLRIRAEEVEPESERQRMVATIEEMHATLEDILVLARSGRAREEVRAMDVAALADALVEEYRELGRDVSFEAGGRQVAEVQPNLLRRAVRNLIDNAVSYGGSAEVSVTREGDELVVAVRDRGEGLPAGELDRVLEPFERAEQSRSRETGGTGLGLPIAKAIAESHGGTLSLANAPDGGLVATLRIPAAD
jgi:signal transduction histidine kinase